MCANVCAKPGARVSGVDQRAINIEENQLDHDEQS